MSMRNKSKYADQRRGPGSYNPRLVSTSAPAYSMGSRFKPQHAEMWQRGPGCYDLGEPKRGPSFSLGARETTKSHKNQSSIPGPGSYNTNKSTFGKNSSPAYSMGSKSTNTNSHASQSPGPGAYNIDMHRGSKSNNPMPNSSSTRASSDASVSSFGWSNMKSAPSFSFGGRSHFRTDNTPGPGSYNVDVNNMKKSGPAYSMASRDHKFKAEKGSNPGPGAYNISSIGRSAPSFTIAQKHQDFS